MSIQKKLGKKPKTIEKDVLIDLTKEICFKVNKISIDEARLLTNPRPVGEILLIHRNDGLFHFDHNACSDLKKAIVLIKYDPIYIDDVSQYSIKEKYIDLVIRLFLGK